MLLNLLVKKTMCATRRTCCGWGEQPAQSRAGLFPSAAPVWTPWGRRAPSSSASRTPEQSVPRLVSAAPPPEPGWGRHGARPTPPSDLGCSEPAAPWQRRCLPAGEQVWISAFNAGLTQTRPLLETSSTTTCLQVILMVQWLRDLKS